MCHTFVSQITQCEAASIARCFKSKDFTTFMNGNLHVEGEGYQFLRVDEDRFVVAKKKEHGGLSMQSSKRAVVIGHCPEGGQLGNTNKGVHVIAEYLKSMNM